MGLIYSKEVSKGQTKETPAWYLAMQGLNDSNQCTSDFRPFSQAKAVVSAVGGMSHSLAILKSGEFLSWGSNRFGQLGSQPDSYIGYYLYEQSEVNRVSFPKQISRIVIISISAGAWHSACVTDKNEVFTWGLGSDGQLGINPKEHLFNTEYSKNERYVSQPALVESMLGLSSNAVFCGGNFTLVKTEDYQVFSFGRGCDGVLGNGQTVSNYRPQEITALNGVKLKKISCGFNHVMALSTQGEVYAWGNLFKDVLFDAQPQTVPVKVEEISDIYDIACGDYHCCALQKKPNQLYVWGGNGYGQLGSGIYPLDYIAKKPTVFGLSDIAQVVCGGLFTVAKLKDNSVYGWGCNRQKQIGEGLDLVVREPILIIRKNNEVKRLVAGYSHLFIFSSEMIDEDCKQYYKDDHLTTTFHKNDETIFINNTRTASRGKI